MAVLAVVPVFAVFAVSAVSRRMASSAEKKIISCGIKENKQSASTSSLVNEIF